MNALDDASTRNGTVEGAPAIPALSSFPAPVTRPRGKLYHLLFYPPLLWFMIGPSGIPYPFIMLICAGREIWHPGMEARALRLPGGRMATACSVLMTIAFFVPLGIWGMNRGLVPALGLLYFFALFPWLLCRLGSVEIRLPRMLTQQELETISAHLSIPCGQREGTVFSMVERQWAFSLLVRRRDNTPQLAFLLKTLTEPAHSLYP